MLMHRKLNDHDEATEQDLLESLSRLTNKKNTFYKQENHVSQTNQTRFTNKKHNLQTALQY